MSSQPEQIVRLEVNLAPDVAVEMSVQAERAGVSLTEQQRRLVKLWHLVQAEMDAGHRVIVLTADGTQRELVLG